MGNAHYNKNQILFTAYRLKALFNNVFTLNKSELHGPK